MTAVADQRGRIKAVFVDWSDAEECAAANVVIGYVAVPVPAGWGVTGETELRLVRTPSEPEGR